MMINYGVTNNEILLNLFNIVIRSIVLNTFELLYLSSFFSTFLDIGELNGNECFLFYNLCNFACLIKKYILLIFH